MKYVGSYPGAWHAGAFPGGSMPPSPLLLPLPLAATHLHIPHPPGAVVFAMLWARHRLSLCSSSRAEHGSIGTSSLARSASILMAPVAGVVVRLG